MRHNDRFFRVQRADGAGTEKDPSSGVRVAAAEVDNVRMGDITTQDGLAFVAGVLVLVLLLATTLPRMPWLIDWQQARRHPWSVRIWTFAWFTILTPTLAALTAPDGHWLEVLVAAPVVGVLGMLVCEPALRRGGLRPRSASRDGQSRLRRTAIWYPIIVGGGAVLWWASGIGLIAVAAMLLGFLLMAQA
jgi:hypothetical protein